MTLTSDSSPILRNPLTLGIIFDFLSKLPASAFRQSHQSHQSDLSTRSLDLRCPNHEQIYSQLPKLVIPKRSAHRSHVGGRL